MASSQNDTINGGSGDDTLDGGNGLDVLDGLWDNDTCDDAEIAKNCETVTYNGECNEPTNPSPDPFGTVALIDRPARLTDLVPVGLVRWP